jgi:hypothetical protein
MAKPIRYCTIDGCESRVWGHGLCQMHYQRQRRHGSTEFRPRKGRPPVPFVACSIEGCTAQAKSKGLCQSHYIRAWHKARYVPAVREPLEDRFWKHVDKRGADECWEWQSARANGYGSFGAVKNEHGVSRNVGAHRMAYELMIGSIPSGFHLHHRCENKACVNPAHLELISPSAHYITTWIGTLRALGYTIIEPEEHAA